MPRLVTLTALPLLAAAAVTAAPPATADTHATETVLADGTGDVWAMPTGSDTTSAAPDHRDGDIVRALVAHRHGAVVVRLTFAAVGGGRQRDELEIRTPDGRYFANVTVNPGRPGTHQLWNRQGNRQPCGGMTHEATGTTVGVRIPRSCLGDPRWVTVAETTFTTADGHLYLDTPLGHDPRPTHATTRLYRG